jgi:hypothetical protein
LVGKYRKRVPAAVPAAWAMAAVEVFCTPFSTNNFKADARNFSLFSGLSLRTIEFSFM